MKNGAPIIEVITPTGSWAGAITVLQIKSERTSNIAPSNAEPGIKCLCFGPMNNRTICGVTSPIKPIIPQKETDIPTIIEAISTIFFLRDSTFNPRW